MSEVYSAGNLHGVSRGNAEFDCDYRDFPRPDQDTLAADSCSFPIKLVDSLAFEMLQWVYPSGRIKANTMQPSFCTIGSRC
jgi:hypothetical protein